MKRQPRQMRLRGLAARRAAQRRRGVLLLVVLSLLTLFLMIATAFLISAGQFRRANRSLAALAEDAANSVSRADFLDEVVGQLLRDTNNANSSLRFHSLLRDLYGNDGLAFDLPNDPSIGQTTVEPLVYLSNSTSAGGLTGGQLVELELTYVNQPGLSQLDDYYNGRLLTFASGALRGQSLRVVDYVVVSLPPASMFAFECRFRLMRERGDALPNPGDRVVLNGAPFNGMGFGYDSTAPAGSARLSANEQVFVGGSLQFYPVALLPNATYYPPTDLFSSDVDQVQPNVQLVLPSGAAADLLDYVLSPAELQGIALPDVATLQDPMVLNAAQRRFFNQLIAARGPTGLGGSDESYDAVDYQNMALARLPVGPAEIGDPGSQRLVDPTSGAEVVLPSFHRPALLNYWQNQVATLPTEPMLLRKVMMRPSWYDHPNFTGSNPDLEQDVRDFAQLLQSGGDPTAPANNLLDRSIYGPWDVDNDGDGVRDSVWVDFGAPVIQGPNGKRVKPLAAVLCVDMDGRLNINAHGSKDLAVTVPADVPNVQTLAGGVTSNQLPQGIGYGPADISLAPVVNPLFGTATGINSGFSRLLVGDSTLPGRYGWDGPVGSPLDPADRAPGETFVGGGMQQAEDSFDLMARVRTFQAPMFANSADLSAYATPPDFSARYALGINDLGQPVYEAFEEQGTYNRLTSDSPYEVDLSENAPRGYGENGEGLAPDAPFSLSEMERVLRAYDADAGSLPGRIWDLADSFGGTTPNLVELNRWRTLLTTDSYDLPTPSTVAPRHIVVGPDGTPDGPGYNAGSDDFADVMAEEVPNPAGTPPTIFVERQPVGLTFADMLEYRVRLGLATKLGGSFTPATVPARRISQEMALLLAPELASGQKLDINRPLGNGVDDDGNRVVDEPFEGLALAPTQADGSPWVRVEAMGQGGFPPNAGTRPQVPAAYNSTNTVYWPVILPIKDLNGNGTVEESTPGVIADADFGIPDRNGDNQITPADALDPAQVMARHLYVLAMTVVDPYDLTNDRGRLKSRRLAQWAINSVDYRDANSVMSMFEVDLNPFDGWDVDGDPETREPESEVIWGAERPELLITEVMAWHDRRTENRNEVDPDLEEADGQKAGLAELPTETKPTPDDASFDQLLRPKGPAFIELYNPWPATPGVNADTHRLRQGGNRILDEGVDIARFSEGVLNDGTPVRSPVWRIASYRRNPAGGLPIEALNHVDPDNPDPDVQLDIPNFLQIDRSIYFTPFDPAATNTSGTRGWDNDGDAHFIDPALYATNEHGLVRPGRLLVVASGDDFNNDGVFEAPVGDFDPGKGSILRRVEVRPNDPANPIRFIDGLGGPDDEPPMMADGNPLTDVLLLNRGRDSVAAPTELGEERRLSLSERRGGYPDNLKGRVWTTEADGANVEEGWYAYGNQAGKGYPLDVPLDDDPMFGDPLLARPGTVPGYRVLYLQRLADPTKPWNPPPLLPAGGPDPNHDDTLAVNPYLTVDQSPVNLSVFNGRNTSEIILGESVPNGTVDSPAEFPSLNTIVPAHPVTGNTSLGFASTERGVSNNPERAGSTVLKSVARRMKLPDDDTVAQGNFWNVENPGLTWGGTPGNGQHYLARVPRCTLGFFNEQVDSMPAGDPDGVPDLMDPLTSVAWNNRPFVNAMELMHVPAVRSSWLLKSYSYRATGTALSNERFEGNPWGDTADGADLMGDYAGRTQSVRKNKYFDIDVLPDGPTGHAFNLFRREQATPNDDVVSGLYRVLDYIGSPSPFVGSETWLNPAAFDTSSAWLNPATVAANLNDPRLLLQPPNNRVPAYREPGRVNLNTIVDESVWLGVRGLFDANNNGTLETSELHEAANWTELIDSRRGYGAATASALQLNNDVPTFFENPFRSADAGELVPLGTPAVSDMTRSGSEPSLARSNQIEPTGTPPSQPRFVSGSTAPHQDNTRNPYFRYQPAVRLASLTNGRSNVYAVWVTIGFFEVEEAPSLTEFETANALNLGDPENRDLYDRVYPEGYTLGREEGSDLGAEQRVRGFYVIDRSIPVGFEPGEDHNAERAVRLRRRIE
ncbi:MAG: hypothetical protein AAGA92_11380 [Planctomycetota bacterium]